jgi:hypothetical protein
MSGRRSGAEFVTPLPFLRYPFQADTSHDLSLFYLFQSFYSTLFYSILHSFRLIIEMRLWFLNNVTQQKKSSAGIPSIHLPPSQTSHWTKRKIDNMDQPKLRDGVVKNTSELGSQV